MDDTVILYCDLNDLSISKLDAYMNKLPEYLKEKMRLYKNIRNKHLSIAGYYLLVIGLLVLDLDEEKILNIRIGTYGKPYVSDNSFYFNISHSESLVTCMVSKKCEVGIDVEYREVFDYKKLNIYSDNEEEIIFRSDDNIILFYDIWTRKEAVVKCLGYGLNLDLKSIDVVSQNLILFNAEYYIYSFTMLEKYSCSFVVLGEYSFPKIVRIKNILI